MVKTSDAGELIVIFSPLPVVFHALTFINTTTLISVEFSFQKGGNTSAQMSKAVY